LGRDSLRPDTAQSAREQRLAERRSASSVLSAFVHVQMYVCMYVYDVFLFCGCVSLCFESEHVYIIYIYIHTYAHAQTPHTHI
jgi:hypothetical protein